MIRSAEKAAFVFSSEVAPEQDGRIHVGLFTLAMGDKGTVEFAVFLQHGVCHPTKLLILRGSVPRGLLQIGVVVDNLVVMEQVLTATFEADGFSVSAK